MQQQPVLNIVPKPTEGNGENNHVPIPEAVDEASGSSAERSKPRRPLPTPRVTVKKQLDLLRAYGVAAGDEAKPVHYAKAAELAGIHPNTATLCNAFFYEINLAKRVAGRIIPSEALLDYARAYEWDPATAAHRLAPVLRHAWFAKPLDMRLRMKPLSEADALRVLGEEAHANPEQHRAQIRMCIEYLAVAGIIDRAGDTLRLAPSDDAASIAVVTRPAHPAESPGTVAAPEPVQPTAPVASSNSPTMQFMGGAIEFQCSVRVTMADLAGWRSDQISALFEGMAKVIAAKNSSGS